MKSLKEREGEEIVALIPFIDKTVLQRVKLHKVEEAGMWIESTTLTQMMLQSIKQQAGLRTPIWFLPWHQLTAVLDSIDQMSLSEKSFGL